MLKYQAVKGKSFIVLMLTIAVVALVLRFAIGQLIKVNISQNDSYAHSTIKLISAALENFAKDHEGAFPDKLSSLTGPQKSYLDKDYASLSPVKGYNYQCSRLDPAGYTCSASAAVCNITGAKLFNISTGGLLVFEACKGKGEASAIDD